ncbi:protein S-acyltransferase 8-like isoform X2 [Cornus florida]|uniref:protein S-acyltransferase 8-like isoform X2 n=1 Tax=Cornus florida TaxID=4283 RepID=UPI0028974156|nr:protein S-acyltransferase 8-like isoform X2 [Cornus florida]
MEKRVYQVWKGSNHSLHLSLRVLQQGVCDYVPQCGMLGGQHFAHKLAYFALKLASSHLLVQAFRIAPSKLPFGTANKHQSNPQNGNGFYAAFYCSGYEESVSHLLLHCPIVSDVGPCYLQPIFSILGGDVQASSRHMEGRSFMHMVEFVKFIFSGRNLLNELQAYNAGYAILVVSIVLTILVLVLLLLTSARDPGIVPRNLHPPEEELCYDSSTSVEVGGRTTPSLQFPRTKEVFVNGFAVRVKYCETCMLYRPPRCSHCSICDNCVERFDHHCPWVGQCIGKRNYRYFFMFVSSSALLCIFVFSMSALNMKFLMDRYGTVWKSMNESPASVILLAYCFISMWFVGGLTGFHLYLIGKNQTTYENFRYRADSRLNVYDRGCLGNFFDVFCSKIEPSRNNFRAHVQEEAPRPPKRTVRLAELDDNGGERRAKVEDDLEIGNDLLKISQRHDLEEGDIRNRGSDGLPKKSSDDEFGLGLELQKSISWSERHHSSFSRRNASMDLSSEILVFNSNR